VFFFQQVPTPEKLKEDREESQTNNPLITVKSASPAQQI
jgi:hypothetical protein